MIVRREKEEDFKSIYEINEQAFKQKDESELIERIRNNKNFIPELSLVAEENGKIIGHILFSKIKIIGEKKYESLALAPMAILPELQRKGIGGRLIKEGLNKARELGFDSVIVLGHKDYYPRFGFERASKWDIKCPFKVPDEAFMAIELNIGVLANKSGIVEYPEEFGNE
ncbi:MAG: N-acetyltransferase [Candidatus Bathyarchaeota archaeon]|nr:N-acetyltransferase [Candidatus Bathyarchaeota archaeon]